MCQAGKKRGERQGLSRRAQAVIITIPCALLSVPLHDSLDPNNACEIGSVIITV